MSTEHQEANPDLQQQLADALKTIEALKGKVSSGVGPPNTPQHRVISNASPASSKASTPTPKSGVATQKSNTEDPTHKLIFISVMMSFDVFPFPYFPLPPCDPCHGQEAQNARLRRLCEKKPSGKCKVSEPIHSMWKEGGTSREELLKIFDAVGENQDPSILCHSEGLQCTYECGIFF